MFHVGERAGKITHCRYPDDRRLHRHVRDGRNQGTNRAEIRPQPQRVMDSVLKPVGAPRPPPTRSQSIGHLAPNNQSNLSV